MIPREEFQVGQKVKCFDSFVESHWDACDVEDWDEDDDDIYGILGRILEIVNFSDGLSGWMHAKDDDGRIYEINCKDVEYIVGGYGDFPDFAAPDVSGLPNLLFA